MRPSFDCWALSVSMGDCAGVKLMVPKSLSLNCCFIVFGWPLLSRLISRRSFWLIVLRSLPSAFITMSKSGSSALSCCLARSRRNVEPTSVAIAGIGAAAESAEAMGPLARLKYCERFFCSALLCDSDALPARCCVDEGSLCSMPNAPKVFLVARICCMRLMSSCRMCPIVASRSVGSSPPLVPATRTSKSGLR